MTRDETSGSRNGAPKLPGKESLRPQLPKRFYNSASVEPRGDGFAVLLDGRGIRTPAKRELVLPSAALADALAAEWQAQGDLIDPSTMPLTRLANVAIDAVEERKGDVAEDIVAFAGSDLLCYRAESPDALARRQADAWDPVLDWASNELGADFNLRVGLMPIAQPPEALEAVRAALAGIDALSLAALHVMTTISGSALLALAHWREKLSVEDAWAAATIDETWQQEQWGLDAEAEALAARRRSDFEAASAFLGLLRSRL